MYLLGIETFFREDSKVTMRRLTLLGWGMKGQLVLLNQPRRGFACSSATGGEGNHRDWGDVGVPQDAVEVASAVLRGGRGFRFARVSPGGTGQSRSTV